MESEDWAWAYRSWGAADEGIPYDEGIWTEFGGWLQGCEMAHYDAVRDGVYITPYAFPLEELV